MKVCGLLFRRSLHAAHTTSPPALILSLFSLKSIYRDHIWYCDDDVWLLVGRFLTKIESVACQIWLSLGQLTIFPCFTCWVDQEQAIRTFYGSDQPPAARPVNGTFPSFYGRSIPLILIKIIRSYLVLYIAQTVPTHPESFHIDRFENDDHLKCISLKHIELQPKSYSRSNEKFSTKPAQLKPCFLYL